MNTSELQSLLINIDVPSSSYNFENELANNAICLNFNGQQWEVYYSERGQKFNLKLFDQEEDACIEALSMILHDIGLPTEWLTKFEIDYCDLVFKVPSKMANKEVEFRIQDALKLSASHTELVCVYLKRESEIWGTLMSSTLKFYKEIYQTYFDAYGMEEHEVGEFLPKPHTVNIDRIKELIDITNIVIGEAPENNDRAIGFMFDCSWDDEHGHGILLKNWKVADIGGQDVAISV